MKASKPKGKPFKKLSTKAAKARKLESNRLWAERYRASLKQAKQEREEKQKAEDNRKAQILLDQIAAEERQARERQAIQERVNQQRDRIERLKQERITAKKLEKEREAWLDQQPVIPQINNVLLLCAVILNISVPECYFRHSYLWNISFKDALQFQLTLPEWTPSPFWPLGPENASLLIERVFQEAIRENWILQNMLQQGRDYCRSHRPDLYNTSEEYESEEE